METPKIEKILVIHVLSWLKYVRLKDYYVHPGEVEAVEL